eukprot:SRR837773.4711.p4 GENE.SRR837773.4711~~SRR837773.4711.p4  ORF type:complete len:166 (+),score=34.23 SRR837773.4711:44-499(+)
MAVPEGFAPEGGPVPGIAEDDEMADGMLLDPPDPLDLLIAHTESGVMAKSRPLDFVRAKFQDLKTENKRLRDRVADLEQTLSIVQTAQEWSSRGMTHEQKEKVKEIRVLLEQAKKPVRRSRTSRARAGSPCTRSSATPRPRCGGSGRRSRR